MREDINTRKQIEKLPVTCTFKNCDWKGTGLIFRSHYEKHQCSEQSDNENSCDSGYHPQTAQDSLSNKDSAATPFSVRSSYSDSDFETEEIGRKKFRYDTKSEDELATIKGEFNTFVSSFEERMESMRKTTSQFQNEKLNALSNNLDRLSNEFSDRVRESERIQKENEELKEEAARLALSATVFSECFKTCQFNLTQLHEMLLKHEQASYNGTLLWKITNVRERVLEAKGQTRLYSSDFYTDRYGYRMCARLNLKDDGAGNNTHLSLFLVLQRGEYDVLLDWPFKQKVTFILFDQSELKENIVDAFKPDPNSSSFKRPEMNTELMGLPEFCSLECLNSTNHQFIKDDTMFIKVVVNTNGLVKV